MDAENWDRQAMPPRAERRPMSAGGELVRADGEVVFVGLRNLSYDGCCIAVREPLGPDERVTLQIVGSGRVEAQVRWCRDGLAGLFFLPADPGEVEVERRDARIATLAEVVLRRPGRSSFIVDVHDVSPRGCRVQLVERPAVGERVTIKFDPLQPLEGEVKWVEGFVAGIAFHHAIHPAVFDHLLRLVAAD